MPTKDPAGKAPPPGGFKEGAYYSGYRILDGKFLAAGEHQPGQRVSKEVISQTSPENVDYIRKLRSGQPEQRPKTIEMG